MSEPIIEAEREELEEEDIQWILDMAMEAETFQIEEVYFTTHPERCRRCRGIHGGFPCPLARNPR